jgi:Mannosyl-glycoprotein endo-beta-N-acetylglucosaminidase
MASGSYAKKTISQEPAQTQIPPRATRQLPVTRELEEKETSKALPIVRPPRVVDEFEEHPLVHHTPWLGRLFLCLLVGVVFILVLVSAGIFQRSGAPQLIIASGAQVFPIQVGGTLGAVNTWQNSNGPLIPKTPIPTQKGPYSVIGKPSLSVDFMNSVLAYYHSPAAGKAQALYDDGLKYGLDPAYALAFFMHESTFGTAGVARATLSLSNMRCVPEYACFNQGGGYARFNSWEQGFEAWFKLIRNLYIAQWSLITIDQIIPVYAPSSDHNNVQGYIASLKHTINTWHAGIIQVT